ncbi:MAG TPA: hypothetical protein PKN34_14640, partial [Azospira sp.]|nr:hypothetical protein [Azospira sp.]
MILALLAALAVPPAFPLHLAGSGCVRGTGVCSPIQMTLNANGTGNLGFLVIGQVTGGPIQWRVDPATGRFAALLGGGFPVGGAIANGCVSGSGPLPTPPALA